MSSHHFSKMRHSQGAQKQGIKIRPLGRGWRQMLVLGLICALLPGCTLNLTQVFIPMAYASIGVCIALLVSPSMMAAVIGFMMGGIIGAAVYNNSLKTDLMERQGLTPGFRTGK